MKSIYIGGAAVVARHISSFCKNLTLLTMIGEKKDNYSLLKNKMPKNVKIRFINKKNSQLYLKRGMSSIFLKIKF